MKVAVSPLIVLLLLGMHGLSTESPQQPPVYRVLRTPSAIQIDGQLEDPAWESAPPMTYRNNLDGSAGGPETESRILYDDHYLYFYFRAVDENIWATFSSRDQPLWTEEVVEVFLQADSSQSSYIELEVNPLGTMLDIFLLDIRKPLRYESWNSQKLQWSVQVEGSVDGTDGDRLWTCEIALPLEDVIPAPSVPPRPGDRWRLNLYRVERRPREASLAWSPTLRDDFHVPSMFGEIVFE